MKCVICEDEIEDNGTTLCEHCSEAEEESRVS